MRDAGFDTRDMEHGRFDDDDPYINKYPSNGQRKVKQQPSRSPRLDSSRNKYNNTYDDGEEDDYRDDPYRDHFKPKNKQPKGKQDPYANYYEEEEPV